MRAAGMPAQRLSQSDAAEAMYWTAAQMVAHHASNGCDMHAGDLLGTGTLSGPTADARASLMELSEGGKAAIHLPTGEVRVFLEDGDELTLAGRATREGFRSIGFGACSGVIAPARA